MDEALFPAFKARVEAYAARFPDPVREVALLDLLPEPGLLPQVFRELALLEPYGEETPSPSSSSSAPRRRPGASGRAATSPSA